MFLQFHFLNFNSIESSDISIPSHEPQWIPLPSTPLSYAPNKFTKWQLVPGEYEFASISEQPEVRLLDKVREFPAELESS